MNRIGDIGCCRFFATSSGHHQHRVAHRSSVEERAPVLKREQALAPREEVRFAVDSALEEAGFEPLVPP